MGPATKWQWTEARHGFSNMDFHSPRLTYKPQLTIWQKQRPILSPSCGAIPWGNQPATRQQIDYTGLLPLCKRQCFVLTGTDIYSAYELVSSKHNASAKTTISGLTECLIIVFYTTLPLIKGPYSKLSAAMSLFSWYSFILPCSLPPYRSWFGRTVEWPFEDSFIVPARWKYLAGLKQYSTGSGTCSISGSNVLCYFYHNQDSQVPESRNGNGCGTTHYYP